MILVKAPPELHAIRPADGGAHEGGVGVQALLTRPLGDGEWGMEEPLGKESIVVQEPLGKESGSCWISVVQGAEVIEGSQMS